MGAFVQIGFFLIHFLCVSFCLFFFPFALTKFSVELTVFLWELFSS